MGRRYDELTRFLKETIKDSKRGPRVRMQAAMKLADIYLEHDRSIERQAIARERAAARIAEAQAQPITPEPSGPVIPATGNAQLSAKAFLDRLTQEMTSND